MAVSSATTMIRRFWISHVWTTCLTLLVCGCSKQTAPVAPMPAGGETVQPSVDLQQPAQSDFTPMKLPADAPPAMPEERVTNEPNNASAPTRVRLADDRAEINSARLQQSGINIYRGKRLVILSDLPEQHIAQLPQLADQLFDTLEAYFGSLPEAADGSEFQVTGHIIGDEQKFRQAALMPSAAFTFEHGKHVNYEFWMFNPPKDYYRRHLMLHEFTHCFMTCESGMNDIPPLWYIEGMAEFFATHRPSDDSATAAWQFGILPDGFDGFDGWGRVSEFRRSFTTAETSNEVRTNTLSIASLSEISPDTVASFDSGFQYSSSWALCWFLNHHPQHREMMKALAAFKHRDDFVGQWRAYRTSAEPALSTDWLLFAESLQEGFDADRAFAKHHDTPTQLDNVSGGMPARFQLLADRGWQDSGLRLKGGQTVQVNCSGSFSVDDQPKPWISEPNGVTIEYVAGLPLGQVVAVLVKTDGAELTHQISVGESKEVTAPFDSSLWLQVNDASNSRANNAGVVEVTLTPVR